MCKVDAAYYNGSQSADLTGQPGITGLSRLAGPNIQRIDTVVWAGRPGQAPHKTQTSKEWPVKIGRHSPDLDDAAQLQNTTLLQHKDDST